MIKIPDYNGLSPAAAAELQKKMRAHVSLEPLKKKVAIIAGADISFNKFDENVRAAIVVLSFPDMKMISRAFAIEKSSFPYISGLLSFREVPALISAWNQLGTKPEVIMLHGQGIAHKMRTGIATHFSLLVKVPAIGCAKSKLTGDYEEPVNESLATSPLTENGEQIGVVLRTKINCNPIFVSPGNKITIAQSVEIVKKCVGEYCAPEPLRLANNLLNNKKTKKRGSGDQPTLF